MVEVLQRLSAANMYFRSREDFARALYGSQSDFDEQCGYPKDISFDDYKRMYEREGIATRVVSVYPSESWSVQPIVYETEQMETRKKTPFEKAWEKLNKHQGITDKLRRLDEASRIGHYGVGVLGVQDGRPLSSRISGINARGEVIDSRWKERDFLYFMPFDEGEARILACDEDRSSLRFGKPTMYEIQMADPNNTGHTKSQAVKVHWTRCVHVADGCTSNNVYGTPAQKKVWNYLLNLRKIHGGSGEMFRLGGFPGTSFEVPPELVGEVELDKEELKDEIEKYTRGFKRYLALSGVTATQLMPNIADPKSHADIQMEGICISIEVPLPIFKGAEEARMASVQNTEKWNKTIHRRYDNHVNPNILFPTIDLFMAAGVLPRVDEYFAFWPDISAISSKDKADNTGKLVRALAEYMKNGLFKLIPPLQFFTMFMDLTSAEAEEVIAAADKMSKSNKMKFLDEVVPVIQTTKMKKQDERNRQGTRRPPLGATRKIKGRT